MLCKHVTAMPFAIVSGALDYLENTRTSTSIDFNFHPLAVIRGPASESHHTRGRDGDNSNDHHQIPKS